MRKFQLLPGVAPHYEHQRMYSAGQVVANNDDLTKAYANKFVEVSADTPDTYGVGSDNGKYVHVGAGKETARSERLPKVGRNADLSSKKPPAKPGQAPPEVVDNTQGEQPFDPDSLGKDMTDKFPKAGEQDFRVYRREGLYFVYDADKLAGGPFNEEGVDKEDVDGVIAKAI